MKEQSKKNQTLVQRILEGDHRAFQILIDDYQRLVGHVVFRMVPNATDQQDLCQDIFLKIYQNLVSFQFQSKLSTWIARIAFNTCLNYLEKKKVALFDDLTVEKITLDSLAGTLETPAEFTERSDRLSRLQREIAQLPLQYRTMLTLYHLEEMSYREIGEIMSMPEGTVKNYLFRARKYLKDRLLSHYQKEELWHSSI